MAEGRNPKEMTAVRWTAMVSASEAGQHSYIKNSVCVSRAIHLKPQY